MNAWPISSFVFCFFLCGQALRFVLIKKVVNRPSIRMLPHTGLKRKVKRLKDKACVWAFFGLDGYFLFSFFFYLAHQYLEHKLMARLKEKRNRKYTGAHALTTVPPVQWMDRTGRYYFSLFIFAACAVIHSLILGQHLYYFLFILYYVGPRLYQR